MDMIKLLNQIKQNSLAKKKYFYFNNIKSLKPFINKLVELNIITIKLQSDKQLKIFLNYDDMNEFFYKNIKIMYSLGRPIHIKTKTLQKIKKFKYNSYYILSTNQGFKTNFEALSCNCGGVLICKFNY